MPGVSLAKRPPVRRTAEADKRDALPALGWGWPTKRRAAPPAIGFLLANLGRFSFSAEDKLYFLIPILFIGALIAVGALLTQYLK